MTFAVLGSTVFLLTVSLYATLKTNSSLVKTKELLILKNDSLHMLQIETRKELINVQNSLDSILPGYTKKISKL